MEALMKAVEQANRIYFEIFDLWSDAADGLWRWEDKVYLDTPEDTYEYDTLTEAAKDCLCTIKERFKEVQPMTFSSLVKRLSSQQQVTVISMDRDGEERELYSGKVGNCPYRYGRFEVATIESNPYVDDYPLRNSIHSEIVITLDEVPEGF